MLRRALLIFALATGCASARLERYQLLTPHGKELYAKYNQFMTEGQRDQYLTLPADEARDSFIKELHVEERLGRYSPFLRNAIWSREVVVGMDKEAVFLTWGSPDEVVRDSVEESNGVERETWVFRRGVQSNDAYRVLIVNNYVAEVLKPGQLAR